ncbi:MAG: hypothetical protein UU03_C0010G0011 [Candidatus Woesebacteria bacterium GW2011_GWA1_40_45]|uniref:Uncharacterized protein n=1 Tax=Candidatus Woesebacteria bacterium GW2011_GWA1_40_45 TaxID=1618554 RepID=A0A0G0VKB1_9BACT|nr:MAG: hypothetical protein UU03_C0010G0011 [Candidatus Woesebacteria bacterium GW2011_GWA1_40_45]
MFSKLVYGKLWRLIWVGGSVVERVPDKNEVDGSIPSRPTKKPAFESGFFYLTTNPPNFSIRLQVLFVHGSCCNFGRVSGL